jgi:hypothetical protein
MYCLITSLVVDLASASPIFCILKTSIVLLAPKAIENSRNVSQVLGGAGFDQGVSILRDSREHFWLNMEFNIIPNNGTQGYSEVPEEHQLPHEVKSQPV